MLVGGRRLCDLFILRSSFNSVQSFYIFHICRILRLYVKAPYYSYMTNIHVKNFKVGGCFLHILSGSA